MNIVLLLSFVTIIADPINDVPQAVRIWFQPQNWVKDGNGPMLSLGSPGEFDDRHIFAPAVTMEKGHFWLWYSGSSGKPSQRVFRLGLAMSDDGVHFTKDRRNPVHQFADDQHSVLTPSLLRNPDGSLCRENGKIRMWFNSTVFGKTGLHTLHESTSEDGVHWSEPSASQLNNAYAASILKTSRGYEMWFTDVTVRPWLIRYALSTDGRTWKVEPRPALQLSQGWESEVILYPAVLMIDGTYLMWYGSYDHSIRRERTAIGFAASLDGVNWFKYPQNPVHRPDPNREWESNYVGTGCVMRLNDGRFRTWYASRKKPPFDNLYFALNTAHWAGPDVLRNDDPKENNQPSE